MKIKIVLILLLCAFLTQFINAQGGNKPQHNRSSQKVFELTEMLVDLANESDNKYFVLHCNSILKVINSKHQLTADDIVTLEKMYEEFSKDSLSIDPGKIDCYLERKREFIIAWVSPTDGAISFTLLKLPKNWNPKTEYPLYVKLHGKGKSDYNPIDYMTRSFSREPSLSFAFEDGYLITPWARGNYWYKGISETDIWECISTIEELVEIDTTRKYLCGFSMGGFGSWYIGQKSVDTWAAIGLHSPSFWYNRRELMQQDVINKFNDVPTYFSCGTKDGNRKKTIKVYEKMKQTENNNINFIFLKEAMFLKKLIWK